MTSHRRPGLTVNPATGRRWTLKDSVFAVLPEAMEQAGDRFDPRTLYYKVRPFIQNLISDETELDGHYFSQHLLPAYEREFGEIDGLYRESRGELHHPHDGEVIKLGTGEVEAYIPPKWQFDKVLYIEKAGLVWQLEPYQLGQRYDMAIVWGKGFSVVACRKLLASSDIRKMKLFVLHDGDLIGYDIARTLGEPTKRMPEHNIEVIDLGLTVQQAIDYGLETETFIRRKALPRALQLDAAALEWFTGGPIIIIEKGRPVAVHKCKRTELNAFSADGLATFITDQLRVHGATEKLVPPPDVLAQQVADDRYDELYDLVTQVIDIDGVVRALMERDGFDAVTERRVRAWLAKRPTKPWRAASEAPVKSDLDVEAMTAAIRDLLRRPS
jgi:hypothetical protein